jgi:hypothetical protein
MVGSTPYGGGVKSGAGSLRVVPVCVVVIGAAAVVREVPAEAGFSAAPPPPLAQPASTAIASRLNPGRSTIEIIVSLWLQSLLKAAASSRSMS